MQEPRLPDDEALRLDALICFDILDSPPDPAFDDLTALAARLCETPIALVSLVDAERQWFKSRVGLDASETPRRIAFCAHAILQPTELLVIPDTLDDERFHDNPLVADEPRIRFYAGAPLVTHDGHALGTLCVIDRVPRTLDDGQREALRTLARQVVAQLELLRANARLEASLDQARAANRAKSEFLANTSHEIRTPLHGIVGSLDLFGATSLSAEQRELLDLVQSSADTLRVIIDDVLDAAKIESGRMAVESVPTDIGRIARSIVALFRTRADQKGIALELALDPALPHSVLGDPVRLGQILTNLVSNAIKFTREGSVRVGVSVEGGEDGRDRLRIEVRDTGVGVSREQHERIFEIFTQASTSTTRSHGGTGLGMYISRTLARLMHGDIHLASTPGVGSTFELIVPTEPACADADRETGPGSARFDARVLVAEDNAVNRRIIGKMLELMGVDFDLVHNGLEAVERASADHDLVLMDIQMPEMDGLQATRTLRERGFSSPIIALTANVMPEDVASYLAGGLDGHLAKPFRRHQMADLLREFLPDTGPD